MVVIEDDTDIRSVLTGIFREGGFNVHVFRTGLEGVEGIGKHRPQVVILDLGLPDIDGFEVARRVRLFSNAYILMLTARTHELDTLLGLEAGADDYLTKPFRPRELRYRVEALLRRPRIRGGSVSLTDSPLAGTELSGRSDPAGDVAGQAPSILEHNGLRLDIGARTVEVDGSELKLTPSEFELLHSLLVGGRSVQGKEDLALVLRGGQPAVGGFGREADEQVVQVHIANLRRKLGDAVSSPRWVETVHGFGYRLAANLAG
jgi:DNA-binding response OmpR family regulator